MAGDAGSDETAVRREALRRVAVALKRGDVPFALAGGYAVYARGGPEPDHDVDFVVACDAVEQAVAAAETAGLRVQRPAEDWLFKVWHGEGGRAAMVDVVHQVADTPVDRDIIERAEPVDVVAVRMPVLSATDILSTKLRAMTEHYRDYARVLPAARALREQVDWDRLRHEVAGNDFAVAFLFLADRLRISP